MSTRTIRPSSPAVISALIGLPICCAAGLWGTADLLSLLPALLLGCLLLARRYPGERLLVRWARRARRVRRTTTTSLASPWRPAVRTPRGGRLMGRGLAVRPPPASLILS